MALAAKRLLLSLLRMSDHVVGKDLDTINDNDDGCDFIDGDVAKEL
jgi:hypothetical protein